ncbi:MAG: acyl-CoA dehydrogenase family protein [Thermodesulfobacteriota bacterium]|nr:acyl-CoA dehydrogenase family protein [Thermodesulfobacteriota bacterium]
MDILHYTDAHEEFRHRLRTFCENEITPFVDEWEKDHIVPKHAWKRMGEEGFLCTAVSETYGGQGKDFLYSVIVAEELARTNHTGLAAPLHSDIVVPYIESYGSEAIKKRFLPGCVSGDTITAVAMTEPDAGSDLAAMTTTAVEDGDEVEINGSKTFITNGINADLVVVAAVDPSVDNPHQAVSLYLVKDGTPGFERGRRLEKMGFHSQDTAELFFNKCRIPVENRLGEKNMGFIMLMEKLQQERLICAVMAQFAVELIVEKVTEYLKTAKDAVGKPLSKYQATNFALVEMATEAKIGRTFMEKLVAEHMEGRDVVMETCMAKYWHTDLTQTVANRALDLIGEEAAAERSLILRGWRDLRVLPIFAGTNEIMKMVVGRMLQL